MKTKIIIFFIAIILFSTNFILAHEGMDHDESMEPKGSMLEHTEKEYKGSKGSLMHDQESIKKTPHVATEEELETLSTIGNKICPVSGEVIADVGDGTGVQVVYQDKIYNLCCSMCAKDFKKNPDKFIEKINEELERSEHKEHSDYETQKESYANHEEEHKGSHEDIHESSHHHNHSGHEHEWE